MEYSELAKRRKSMIIPTSLVMQAICGLWTRKMPKIITSEDMPDGAIITMIQKRRESDEYAINIVCATWPEVEMGTVSQLISISRKAKESQ